MSGGSGRPVVEYSVLVDIGPVDPDTVGTEPFALYRGRLRTTGTSTEVVVTVAAAELLQAVATALAVVTVSGHPPRAVRALPSADLEPECAHLDRTVPTLTVEQAAALLGTSTQAITKRLRDGALPGTKDGRDWRILKQAVDEEVNRWHQSTTREQHQAALTAMRRLLAERPTSPDADLAETGREAITSHPKFRTARRRRSWYPVDDAAVGRVVAAALEECRTVG